MKITTSAWVYTDSRGEETIYTGATIAYKYFCLLAENYDIRCNPYLDDIDQ